MAKSKPRPLLQRQESVGTIFYPVNEITGMVSKKKPGSDKKKDNPAMDNKKAVIAHDQAEKDIRQDPDLAPKTNPEDKMDEGELARFEGKDE